MSFMQPQPRSVLPPATQLFLDSLKAGVKLQTPNGQPTVAAQVAQSTGITQAPQQPQQGGVPPVTPEEGQRGLASILDQLKQSQQAGPSVANNQQQAQVQQVAQQAQNQPQQMAEGGLAGLPVNMHEFAEGGIIGFDEGGPTTIGSAISHALPSLPSSQSDFAADQAAWMEQHPEWKEPPKSTSTVQLKPGTDPLHAINQLFAALKATKDPAEQASIRAAILQIPFEPGGAKTQTSFPNVPDHAMASAAIAPSANQTAPAPAPVPPAMPDVDKSVHYNMPNISEIMSEIKKVNPEVDTSKQEALAAEQEKFLRNRPDFGAIANATATKNLQDAQAMDEQQRFLGLMSANPLLANSASRVAAETSNFNNLILQRNAAYRIEQDANNKADFAAKAGDFTTFQAAQAAITAAKQKQAEINAVLAAHMYSGQAGITAADINAQRNLAVMQERMAGLAQLAQSKNEIDLLKAQASHIPGATPTEILNINKYLDEQFNPAMLGEGAREAIAQIPTGPKLLAALANKGMKAEEVLSDPEAMRIFRQAKENARANMLGQSKWGNTQHAIPYNQAPATKFAPQ
jgi:hypothetical protein